MITVHHLNNSRSQRVLWLLEEIGTDYTIEKYMRDAQTMRAPDSLKAVHPLGKSPVITDGDITVAESGAIVEYLVDTYATQLKPDAGTPAHRAYVYWMHFSEGSAMPPMLIRLLVDQIGKAKMPFFAKPIAKSIVARLRAFVDPEIDNIFRYIEDVLGQSDWLAGDSFTAADIQMSFPLEAASARAGIDKTTYPNIHAWLDRIHSRPAYARALEKGGEYGIVGS